MKTLYVVLATLAFSMWVLAQTNTRAITIADHYLSPQSTSENELGITQYPRVTYLPEATQRLLNGKAPAWLLARVYHTDDSIKDVVKYFKAQAQQVNKPATDNAILRSLLFDNWRVNETVLRATPSIFGLGDDLRKSSPSEKMETSFGVIETSDSYVRVHLMSPHPSSADNETLSSGTMIVLIRERLLAPAEAASIENTAEGERVYNGRDVTCKARVKSKPAPAPVGVSGTVVLRVVFSATGKVTDVKLVSGVPGLVEPAVNAARKIKFEPAIKDGHFVAMSIQLEYNFMD